MYWSVLDFVFVSIIVCENSILFLYENNNKHTFYSQTSNVRRECLLIWHSPTYDIRFLHFGMVYRGYYVIDLSLVHAIIFILPCIILMLFKLWTKVVAKSQAEIITRKLNEELVKLVWQKIIMSYYIICYFMAVNRWNYWCIIRTIRW